MKFTIITLFPEMFDKVLNTSMLWKAQEKGLAKFNVVNLREFGLGPRRQLDDAPYGGGDGMLMRPEPIFAAVESIKSTDPTAQVLLMTPRGTLWSQKLAREFAEVDATALRDDLNSREKTPAGGFFPGEESRLAKQEHPPQQTSYILICPHYEGYDERILSLVDHQLSIGHYILTGGELPALIIIDSIVRLIPGVLGGATSAEIESFSDDTNLEYPQYTRPENFRGLKVPDVLLSGNHGEIARWRKDHSGSISTSN